MLSIEHHKHRYIEWGPHVYRRKGGGQGQGSTQEEVIQFETDRYIIGVQEELEERMI